MHTMVVGFSTTGALSAGFRDKNTHIKVARDQRVTVNLA